MTRYETNRRLLAVHSVMLHVAGLAVTAGCLVLSVWAMLEPAHASLAQVLAEQARLDALLKSAPEIRNESRRLRHQLTEAEATAAALAAQVPSSPHEADFLAQMTSLARDVELEILDYRPGVARAGKKCGEMEVQFSARGSYSAVCRYLYRSREMPRLSQVTRLDVKMPRDGEKLHIDLVLLIYFSQPGESAAVETEGARG